jgi:hypothetical protein
MAELSDIDTTGRLPTLEQHQFGATFPAIFPAILLRVSFSRQTTTGFHDLTSTQFSRSFLHLKLEPFWESQGFF